mmetsp:Transcript_29388/g.73805  ORF Transcript_29388/g.73805 Transcript_29388/m.73805 type:complete len:211 (+) Transcript_29388:471-1103(+)
MLLLLKTGHTIGRLLVREGQNTVVQHHNSLSLRVHSIIVCGIEQHRFDKHLSALNLHNPALHKHRTIHCNGSLEACVDLHRESTPAYQPPRGAEAGPPNDVVHNGSHRAPVTKPTVRFGALREHDDAGELRSGPAARESTRVVCLAVVYVIVRDVYRGLAVVDEILTPPAILLAVLMALLPLVHDQPRAPPLDRRWDPRGHGVLSCWAFG